MRQINPVVAAAFALLAASCDLENIRIRVKTPSGAPVEDAEVSGGIDWDYFEAWTDRDGYAVLPRDAAGQGFRIAKDNHLTTWETVRSGATYRLEPTRKQLVRVGPVDGEPVLFRAGTLVTVTYQGEYHGYAFGPAGLTEFASAELQSSIRRTAVRGDSLWFSTHNTGLFVYSLADLRDPRLLLHVDVPGYLGPFALKDSFVVTGCPHDSTPLEARRIGTRGPELVASFGRHRVGNLFFRGQYLIVLAGYSPEQPVVYDLQDPGDPKLVYAGSEPDYRYAIPCGQYLVMLPRAESLGVVRCGLLDLTNPARPRHAGTFEADSRLDRFIDDTTAVGRYHTGGYALVNGDFRTGFSTSALLVDGNHSPPAGGPIGAPPYFVTGGYLYRLTE